MAKRAKKAELALVPTAEKPKRGRPPNPNKQPKAAKAKAPSAPGKGHNKGPTDRNQDDIRENFLHHRSNFWMQYRAKKAVLDKYYRDGTAAMKADGHKVGQMKIADALAGTAKQRAKIEGSIEEIRTVALYIGDPLSAQLDMFAQPDRTPAVDRARDEGKQASMENKPCKPPYDPSTPQYQSFMEGYQEDQARIAAGIKPLKDEDGEGDDEDGGGWGESSERDPARPLQ